MATDSSTPADRPHSPWRRPLRIAGGLFAAWILLLACITGVPVRLARIVGLLPPLKGPPFTIASDTTLITEPLDANGWPDYHTHVFNAKTSSGLTRETNVVTLLRSVVGESVPRDRATTALDTALGLNSASSPVPSFQPLAKLFPRLTFDERSLLIGNKLRDAGRSAWSGAERPDVAILIEENAAVLDALVEGSHRPHWYVPQFPLRDSDGSAYHSQELPTIDLSVDIMFPLQLLVARAVRRDTQRSVRQAIDELAAVTRIGRTWSQDRVYISILIGTTLDAAATRALNDVIMGESVTEADLDYLGEVWDRLAPLSTPAEGLEHGDRLYLTQRAVTASFLVTRGVPQSDFRWGTTFTYVSQMRFAVIDWDLALRRIQARIDESVRIARLERYSDRVAELSRFRSQLVSRMRQYEPRVGLEVGSFLRSATTNGEAVAAFAVRELVPHPTYLSADFKHLARQRLLRLAIALRRVHLRTGRFPDSLDALPAEFAALSRLDPFTDADPFHYQVTPEGCLLYSVGPNGQSEQDDVTATPEGSSPDDIVVKLTVPPPDQSP